jgi:hypothetical protein
MDQQASCFHLDRVRFELFKSSHFDKKQWSLTITAQGLDFDSGN